PQSRLQRPRAARCHLTYETSKSFRDDHIRTPTLRAGCKIDPGYHRYAMESFVQGWSLTILFCGFIVLVFLGGWLHVHRELAWVKALTDHLGLELVDSKAKPGTLEQQQIRDEAHAILEAKDPAWAQKQVR